MNQIKKCISEVYRYTAYQLYNKYVEKCFQKGSLPLFYRIYLSRKEKLVNGRKNDVTFVFLSDLHWGANRKYSPLIVKHLIENSQARMVFSGGDIITHSDESKEAMLQLWNDYSESFSFMGDNFYQIYGNHDNNSYQQKNEDAVFSSDEIKKCQKIGDGLRIGETYSFYIDDKDSRTRYLCLDTGKQHLDETDFSLISETLKSTPPTGI